MDSPLTQLDSDARLSLDAYIDAPRGKVFEGGALDGYSPAPLLIIGEDADEALIAAQNQLARSFTDLAREELTPYTKPKVIDYVSRSIVSRMHQREGLNGISYIKRLHESPSLSGDLTTIPDERILDACEDLKVGRGTALQNELGRVAFGMNSVEYANLTIIGEKRKNLEAAMWQEIGQLVGKDATPNPELLYGTQVLGFDRDIKTSDHIGAMRIGMKRYLGVTEFGAHVKARTTAIINMSPSTGVSESLVERLRETAIDAKQQGKDERLSVSQLPEFQSAVRWLVRSKLPEGLVLARNETIYGVQLSEASSPNRSR